MKHQCSDCKKTFLYPAKAIETEGSVAMFESMVCPYCKSLNIVEYVELRVDDVSSVVQVEYAQADGYLKQGYKVKEYYAKLVTLVKPSEPKMMTCEVKINESTGF